MPVLNRDNPRILAELLSQATPLHWTPSSRGSCSEPFYIRHYTCIGTVLRAARAAENHSHASPIDRATLHLHPWNMSGRECRGGGEVLHDRWIMHGCDFQQRVRRAARFRCMCSVGRKTAPNMSREMMNSNGVMWLDLTALREFADCLDGA